MELEYVDLLSRELALKGPNLHVPRAVDDGNAQVYAIYSPLGVI